MSDRKTPIPHLPLRPIDDYLRTAMVKPPDEGDVKIELHVQPQTDPHLMPIEKAAVSWPEKLSPRVPVATLRIPRQKLDFPEQIAFARRLSYNPWHCPAEHCPLGNQDRARRRVYYALSKSRHDMRQVPHYELNGPEYLPQSANAMSRSLHGKHRISEEPHIRRGNIRSIGGAVGRPYSVRKDHRGKSSAILEVPIGGH